MLTTAGQTTNGWLCYSLDVITQNFAMSFCASFAKSFASFSTAWHFAWLIRVWSLIELKAVGTEWTVTFSAILPPFIVVHWIATQELRWSKKKQKKWGQHPVPAPARTYAIMYHMHCTYSHCRQQNKQNQLADERQFRYFTYKIACCTTYNT